MFANGRAPWPRSANRARLRLNRSVEGNAQTAMTPPKDSSESSGKPSRPSPPLWRLAFDAVERPVGAASEAWVQSDVFMDALSTTWKVQRRVTKEVHRGIGLWLGMWNLPRRSDVTSLVTQVANLERQVRQLSRELERRDRDDPPGPRQRPASTTKTSPAPSSNGGED